MDNIKFGEFEISRDFYNQQIANFAESFSYTSLSCEQAFKELKDCENELLKLFDQQAKEYFDTLDENTKKQILEKLRFFTVYSANYTGIKLDDTLNFNSQEWIDTIFSKKFSEMNEYLPLIIVFNAKEFDERETYRKVISFFRLYNLKKVAYLKAQNMKKNHIDAFYYALALEKLNPQSIIELNSEVTKDQENHEIGFKKVNNIIQGATFSTAEKVNVPQAIEQLLYSYQNNFGETYKDFLEEGISNEEKNERLLNICTREARFHIEFERIHPFSDGNGRTGRIILNRNLIKQGITPILITTAMYNIYTKFIEERDYKGLGNLIYISVSQEMARWVSELRASYKIEADSVEKLPFLK